jgi:hypothetical protein
MKLTLSRSLALACLSLAPLSGFAASGLYGKLDYTPRGNLGQAIVDSEMAAHPELKLITLHVTPIGVSPDADDQRFILCSSIGRIGKHDNQEDIDAYKAGKEILETDVTINQAVPMWSATQAPKYEIMTPILTKSGEKVGLAVFVFGYKPGDDTSKYVKIAHRIRDDIRAAISAKDDLLQPAN